MARAKYKLGTLVKATRYDGESVFGEIEAIITNKVGYKYDVKQGDETHVLEETEITQAYRAVVERARAAKSEKKKGKKSAEEKANG